MGNDKKTKKLLTNLKVYLILGQNSIGEGNYVKAAGFTKEVNKMRKGVRKRNIIGRLHLFPKPFKSNERRDNG